MPSTSSLNDTQANLCRNLRVIVDRSASVAEFCRSAGFNRQQFNKYLAGTHTPSRRSLIRIAEQCGLGAQDLLLAPHIFKAKLEQRPSTDLRPHIGAHFRKLETFARSSGDQMKSFVGTYYRYHNSSIYPGRVVRAVTVIYLEDEVMHYVTIESMTIANEHGAERYHFTYRGVCYLMGNRVFMSDYESKQCNEITSAILMPQFRTPIRYMFGIHSGIAATAYGQAYATRVAFERISDSSRISRQLLRNAALIAPEDPSIPASVRRYFEDPTILFAAI